MQNYVERLFICAVLVVSSLVHATIFGNITVQILNFDATKVRRNAMVKAIEGYMSKYGLQDRHKVRACAERGARAG